MALTNLVTSLVLDVYDHDTTPTTVKAIALDKQTRYIKATLTYRGADYPVDENATVTLTVIRPDKTGVQVTGSVVDVDNADRTGTIKGVSAELSQTALALKGTLKAQFMVAMGDQILRTEIFSVKNGEALDADVSEWAGEYQGYNLDELVQSVNSAVATVGEMESDVADLKEGLQDIPTAKTPEETEADLYISDVNGNVLAEFADGHIKTKNFDSSDINVGNTAKIATTSAQTDLDITDANGYVAVRIKDGAIITPNFSTDNAVDAEGVSSIITDEFPSQYLEKYRLNGIKWDALGDSLTAPATVGLSHKNYTRWISEANGINLNNLGVGGKGYWQGIEDEVAGIRSDTDIVTIFGSLNDITNYIANPGVPTDTWADGKTNYCARARRVFDAILAVRNDIRIGVILPTPWVNYNCYDTDTATQENVENMLDALKGICKIYGIPVLDMYHGSNLRPWDSDFRTAYYVAADGYHPNELGNKLFVAPQIEAFLRSLAISY